MPEWLTFILASMSGVLGAGVMWGVLSTRVRVLEERVRELAMDKVTKESFDGFKADLLRRIDHLEELVRSMVRT